MKRAALFAALVFASATACAPAIKEVPPAPIVKAPIEKKLLPPPPAIPVNPWVSVDVGGCCGGSMSASAHCLNGQLRNFTEAPAQYTWTLKGKKPAQCSKMDYSNCPADSPPGTLCLGTCVQYAPPIAVTVHGPGPVTVPANSSAAEVKFVLSGPDNTYYLTGATIELMDLAGKRFTSAELPWIAQCVQ